VDLSLSDRQRELIEIARGLGRDRFAPRAARYDEAASFPFENYDDLRAARFLALTIPERYGGLGADFATYCLVSCELGRWCGATALTFNMHAATMLWTSQMADDLAMSPADRESHERNRQAVYRRVLKEGAIFAQTSPLPGPTVPAKTLPVPDGGESLVINPTTGECRARWRRDLRWTREEFDKSCAHLGLSK